MLEELLTILGQFDKLAASLAALRTYHVENPETLACLENAERHARRGAELTRSQIDALNGKPLPNA